MMEAPPRLASSLLRCSNRKPLSPPSALKHSYVRGVATEEGKPNMGTRLTLWANTIHTGPFDFCVFCENQHDEVLKFELCLAEISSKFHLVRHPP